jgi:NAD(P)-dependent dehydrogenase (short-subunit alcohol dehydrogenase family)
MFLNNLIPNIKDGGKIINISGGGATNNRPNFSSYAVSKTGLIRYSEILASELKESNINVNCVAPGNMYSKMTEEVIDAGIDIVGESEYKNALNTKETGGFNKQKTTELIMYLLSDRSNHINGKLISSEWDDWKSDDFNYCVDLYGSIYTLRRTTQDNYR